MNTPASSISFLTIAALLFVVAGVGWGVAVHQVLTARESADRAQSAAAASAGAVLAVQEKTQIARQTKSARADLMALAIAPGGDAGFISELETLAGQASVTLTVTSVTAVPPSDGSLGSLALNLQIRGSWRACMRFLALVETEHAALNISTVSFIYNAEAKKWLGALTLSAVSFDSP